MLDGQEELAHEQEGKEDCMVTGEEAEWNLSYCKHSFYLESCPLSMWAHTSCHDTKYWYTLLCLLGFNHCRETSKLPW